MRKSNPAGISEDRIPRHIAIIMDGNGRWAQKRLLPRTMGHRAGMNTLKEIVRACDDIGVSVLTVFAFSTENWKRPREEVDYLMTLLIEFLRKELNELIQNQVHIRVSGDYQVLPRECQVEINRALESTRNNTGLVLNIALNYGARKEILQAAAALAEQVSRGEVAPEEITEDLFANLLSTSGLPDPDLLIRTAGEMRISNFLLWQIAYTELWVTERMWPDFTREDLYQAIRSFQSRDRRFGGLSKTRQGKNHA